MGKRDTGVDSSGLFTRRGLAQAFGVHMQTVTGWEQEGMPIELRGTRGRPTLYRLKDCIAWRIEKELRARGAAETSRLSPQEQRALLDEKRREELDLRIRLRRGELIEVDEAARDLANVAGATKARLRRIPAAIAERVVATAQSGPSAVKSLLLAEIDGALRELAAHGDEDTQARGTAA